MPFLREQAEVQFDALVLVMTVPFVAVTRQLDALTERNDQSFFVQVAGFEVQRIDEDIASIAQVGDGGGEEAARGEDGVVIPAFDTEALQRAQGVEAGGLEVAVQQGWRAQPTWASWPSGWSRGPG